MSKNNHLDMSCCMCYKQVDEVEHFAFDKNGDVIVMCTRCYDKAKPFFSGGAKNVES